MEPPHRVPGQLRVLITAAVALLCSAQTNASGSSSRTIVFVCEHGAARSVIAAAYFNKLAAERGLDFHAVARGVSPQPDLSVSAVAGLDHDGVGFPRARPKGLSEADWKGARRIVTFCPLPNPPRGVPVDAFEVPAPGDGYEASRDAILVHVRALIDELCRAKGTKR
jgi:arsenate reductase